MPPASPPQPIPDPPDEPPTIETPTQPPSLLSSACSSPYSIFIFFVKSVAFLWIFFFVCYVSIAYFRKILLSSAFIHKVVQASTIALFVCCCVNVLFFIKETTNQQRILIACRSVYGVFPILIWLMAVDTFSLCVLFYLNAFPVRAYTTHKATSLTNIGDVLDAACAYSGLLALINLDKEFFKALTNVLLIFSVLLELLLGAFLYFFLPTDYYYTINLGMPDYCTSIVYLSGTFSVMASIPWLDMFLFQEMKEKVQIQLHWILQVLGCAAVFLVHTIVIWRLHYCRGVSLYLSHSIDLTLSHMLCPLFWNLFTNETISVSAIASSCILMLGALWIF